MWFYVIFLTIFKTYSFLKPTIFKTYSIIITLMQRLHMQVWQPYIEGKANCKKVFSSSHNILFVKRIENFFIFQARNMSFKT